MMRECLITFIKKNRNFFLKNKKEIITSVIILFILSKFFLTFELWKDRFNPPSFDDAYFYIINIAQILEKQSFNPNITNDFNNINYFTYNSILASLCSVTNIEPIKIFHFFFYFGSLILPFCCYIFVKSLIGKTDNFDLLVINLVCLSAFNGYVSYHGFYWVVPSFVMMILFMSLIAAFEKGNMVLIFLVASAFLLSHPMAIYATLIIFGYLLIKYFLKDYDLKKIISFIFIVILANGLILSVKFYRNIETSGWTSFSFLTEIAKERVENLAIDESNNKNEVVIPKKISSHEENLSYVIKDKRNYFLSEYVSPIVNNKPFLILFALSLVALIYFRSLNFLALYALTFLAGYLATVVNNYGYRFLYFTWLVTFLIISHFFYFILKMDNRYAKIATYFLLSCFFFIGLGFNLSLVANLNKQEDYFWDRKCIETIVNENKDYLFTVEDKYSSSIMLYLGFKKPVIEDQNKIIFTMVNIEENNFVNANETPKKIKECGLISFYKK